MWTSFLDVVCALRREPLRFLDCRCADLLGAFVAGYRLVDAGATGVWRGARLSFPGPDGADAASRALLNHPTSEEAFDSLVLVLEEQARDSDYAPKPGPLSDRSYFEFVREPLLTRPAMVLGTALVTRLAHQVGGYLAGLEVIAPDRGESERRAVTAFEAQLQKKYEAPRARWGTIIRVFWGNTEEALTKFVSLWEEANS